MAHLVIARRLARTAVKRAIRRRLQDIARRELRRRFETARRPTDVERALGGVDLPDQFDSIDDLPL